jgi:hypothetical protein
MSNTDGWIYEGQEYSLILSTERDLSGETGNVKFEITDPDNNVSTVTPTIDSPATDGNLSYTFPVDYLTIGLWQIRWELINEKIPGRIYWLRVMPKIEESNIPAVIEMRSMLEGYGISETVLSDDWFVRMRDNFVIPWMESKIGQSLGVASAEQKTEYVSGTGSKLIILSRRPIVDLVSISYTNVQNDQYVISINSVVVLADEGIIIAKSDFGEGVINPLFARGTKNIKVIYTYGYVNVPSLLRQAIICLTCEKALGQVANRTGGGNLSVQGFSRNHGNRGKWDNIRNELARDGISALKSFLTGTVGNV